MQIKICTGIAKLFMEFNPNSSTEQVIATILGMLKVNGTKAKAEVGHDKYHKLVSTVSIGRSTLRSLVPCAQSAPA